MNTPFNPAYNQVRKTNKNRFTLVTRVPQLPEAAPSYENTILFDGITDTFYKCSKRDGAWVWDPVSNPKTQFVTSAKIVNRMVDREVFKFNHLVEALNTVISELVPFGLVYSALPDYEENNENLTGADYRDFANKCNEIIKDINRISGRNLSFIDAETIAGDNLEEARLKLNALILAVNPHGNILNDIQTVIESGSVDFGDSKADHVFRAVYDWYNETEEVGVVDEHGDPVIDPETGEQEMRESHVNWDDAASEGNIENMSTAEIRSLLATIIRTANTIYGE